MNPIKIFNPLTKRHVLLSGAIGRNLVEQYKAGKIKLLDEDILKLNTKDDKKMCTKISPDTYFIRLSSFDKLTPIKTQGTSIMYTGLICGEKFFVKDVVKRKKKEAPRINIHNVIDVELATNELLASRIYTDVYGIDAIRLFIVINDTDLNYPKFMIASKVIEIDACEPITSDCKSLIENKIPGAIEPFLVDCILANWDIGSRGNIGITSHPFKKAFRLDVGGSLSIRALGQKREFTTIPIEHEAFFIPANKGYKLFKNLNKSQIKTMYEILERTDLEKLDVIKNEIKTALQGEKITLIDKKKCEVVLNIIDIVKARHSFYIENKRSIERYLYSKAMTKN